MSHPPKILSWLSRKARLHPRHSQALWQEAVAYAQSQHSPDHPDYWPAALHHLTQLIAHETATRQNRGHGIYPSPHLHEMMDYHSRMVVTAFHTWENVARVTREGWNQLVKDWKIAA